jgi:hypothetical protein
MWRVCGRSGNQVQYLRLHEDGHRRRFLASGLLLLHRNGADELGWNAYNPANLLDADIRVPEFPALCG